MKKQLLLGCGHSRKVCVYKRGENPDDAKFEDLYTLDINADCQPDLQCDLDLPIWCVRPLNSQGEKCTRKHALDSELDVLDNDFFDEVHAYEVLEHLGMQGREDSFFDTFVNIYRVLVPGGLLLATTPSRFSPWLWGDPGHRRAIIPESLTFLDQTEYKKQLGKTAMSDYRNSWKGDFEILSSVDNRTFHTFVLKAHKPVRA